MSVYTVHEPPPRAGRARDPERFAFVRDGFSGWAFIAAALWMLWHRMWLVLIVYLVVVGGIEAALQYAGVSSFAIVVAGFLISLLIGFEAGTLRRFTLARRGWRNVGIVSGDSLEEAERRFFDAWVHQAAERSNEPTVAAPAPTAYSPPRPPQPPHVIGLFPEPGAGP